MKRQSIAAAQRRRKKDDQGTGGFRPAFMDAETRNVFESRFADGQPAPFHTLEGLPDAVVTLRDDRGRVAAFKDSLVAGFVRNGLFYSREEAAGYGSLSPHATPRQWRKAPAGSAPGTAHNPSLGRAA